MEINYVEKRRLRIEQIDLNEARILVKDLPFIVLEPEDVRFVRERLGLTQDQLADFLGVTRNAIYRWEVGINDVPNYIGLTIAGLCFLRIAYEVEVHRKRNAELGKSSLDPKRLQELYGPNYGDQDSEEID